MYVKLPEQVTELSTADTLNYPGHKFSSATLKIKLLKQLS